VVRRRGIEDREGPHHGMWLVWEFQMLRYAMAYAMCANAVPTIAPKTTSIGWCQPSLTLLAARMVAMHQGKVNAMSFQCSMMPESPLWGWAKPIWRPKPNIFKRPFKKSAKKTKPAKAADE
jgi:hypothetical protein